MRDLRQGLEVDGGNRLERPVTDGGTFLPPDMVAHTMFAKLCQIAANLVDIVLQYGHHATPFLAHDGVFPLMTDPYFS